MDYRVNCFERRLGHEEQDGGGKSHKQKVKMPAEAQHRHFGYFVRHIDCNPCRGGDSCSSSGRCVITEDMSTVLDHFRHCDALIVSTPVYYRTPTICAAVTGKIDVSTTLYTGAKKGYIMSQKKKPATISAEKPAMTKDENRIAVFKGKEIRKTIHNNEWWFVIEDVVSVLTDSVQAKGYIKDMRRRDPELSKGWGQIATPLPIQTSGGEQNLNCAR